MPLHLSLSGHRNDLAVVTSVARTRFRWVICSPLFRSLKVLLQWIEPSSSVQSSPPQWIEPGRSVQTLVHKARFVQATIQKGAKFENGYLLFVCNRTEQIQVLLRYGGYLLGIFGDAPKVWRVHRFTGECKQVVQCLNVISFHVIIKSRACTLRLAASWQIFSSVRASPCNCKGDILALFHFWFYSAFY